MKIGGPKLWISLFSLVAVLMVAVVDTKRTSPGPLTSVHARVEALEGGESCASCHGGWFSTMTASCLECHQPIAAQIETSHGIHGTIAKELADNCAQCHGEHHGTGFAIVNRGSFRSAGIDDPDAFDHKRIGWDMNGRHAELGCVECHTNARKAVLGDGEQRFTGLTQDCASCHEDPHKGRMQVSCATCHGQTKWDQLFSVGHEKFLPLVGGHGDVACRKCHADTSSHSLELEGNAKEDLATRTCVECHNSPHEPDFVAAASRLEVKTDATVCVACHAAEHTTFREPTLKVSAVQHLASGFALDEPHDKASCDKCHDPRKETFAERYPHRKPETCSACHTDPHGGQFATGHFAGQQCTACHDRTHFAPNAFTVDKHAATAFPLDGAHTTTACNDCHEVPSTEAPRIFHGTPGRCEECHQDAHLKFFDAREDRLPENSAGECARCHTTADFERVPEKKFDHEQWTGFAVRGAHAQSECASCHVAMKVPDDTGRTFGRVAEHFGKFEGCSTCHADPHQGQFDTAKFPASIEGRVGCARCHDESSFRSLANGFDHARWTGFALTGGHATAACSACHLPLRPAAANGRTWDRALGTSCADCHDDPHAGQFTVDDANDCARCHESSRPAFLAFDHDRDSNFRLGEQHVGLACSACHLPTKTTGGVEFVRYKPLGTQCTDCHGVHEDVPLRKRRRNP